MNNDARFFFYLSGFTGFLFFFFFALIISEDIIKALVLASFGCLFFSIAGRFLLGFILNSILLNSDSSNPSKMSSSAQNNSLEQDPVSTYEGKQLSGIDRCSPIGRSTSLILNESHKCKKEYFRKPVHGE